MTPNVTLKQLRAFLAVLDTGSFAGAAEATAVTPPAITIAMRQLEEAIGLPILERGADGVRPTEAGEELRTAAMGVEAALARCGDRIEALKGAARGRATVGVISTAKYFAPKALGAFAKAYPTIELKLVVGNRRDILEALAGNAVDLAIMGRPPEDIDLDRFELGDNPHVVIAAPDHPLAGTAAIEPSELLRERFLVREPGSGTRILMERFFAQNGVAPEIAMEIGSNETLKQAVIAGLGISFISAHTIAAEIGDGRLVALDVKGLPIRRKWFVVHRADRRLLPAPHALIDFLAAEGRRFLPELPRISGA